MIHIKKYKVLTNHTIAGKNVKGIIRINLYQIDNILCYSSLVI